MWVMKLRLKKERFKNNPDLIRHNDRIIGIFWRDWRRDKRMEMKRIKRRLFIAKIKRSKKFKIKQRDKR